MSNNQTRLRVKLGAAEIEYEGDSLFLKDEVMPTLDKIIDMAQARIDLLPSSSAIPVPTLAAHASFNADVSGLTTNTIANILQVKSGSDLVMAAVACIILVQKNTSAVRSKILEEMKSATSFYKDSYGSNLSVSLKTLTKGRLRLMSNDTYALEQKEQKVLEAKLAETNAPA